MSERKFQTIDDLMEVYDCEFLEERGKFVRVTTEPEASAWYCRDCGSLDVDAHDGVCYECEREYEERRERYLQERAEHLGDFE